jgi:peptidoglycan hydrolase-like protein with peptidoglycan-binding domain
MNAGGGMAESPERQKASKLFDLLKNPFCILAIEPAASLEKIGDAFDDAVTDRNASESDLATAREALINPRQRTSAELSSLIDTHFREAKVIYAALKNQSSLSDLCRVADRLAPLSKANLLAHIASHQPANADLLFALVDAHAHIDLNAVYAKLESIRKAAGVVIPSVDSVRDELHALLSSHAKAALSGYSSSQASADPVEECTKRILTSADSDRIDALEGLVRAFGQKIAPELGQIEEQIRGAAELLRTRPHEIALVNPIASSLHDWIKLARPMIELDAHKERDEERARKLFNEVRSLAIDLANKHDSFDVALSISNIAAEVFRSLPRAAEQLKEDLRILEERSAEALVIPLKNWIDKLSNWVIVRDLENGGFGPSSVGEAKELWDRFVSATKQAQQGLAAELPWILLRSLAIDINNDEGSPRATKAILEGLIRFANEIPPTENILDKIYEDLRTVDRSIRENKLVEDIKENRVSAALEGIYELLRNPKSPEECESLTSLKAGLERKRTGQYIKWTAFGLVGAVILYANISDKPFRPNYDSSPSRQLPSNPSNNNFPVPNRPSQTAQPLIETKPSMGSGNVLSQTEIRYCRYQKERFKAIEKDLRNNQEINAFNAIVDDYNNRCSAFRYREDDLRFVTTEVNEKAEALAAEGRNILSGWRVRSSLQPPPATQITPPLPQAVPPLPKPLAPANPQSGSASINSPALPAIDLLQLDTVIDVQKRLGDLGYFRGPNNGTWGPQSRNSLRSFKVANGLTDDDSFDAVTASRLYSSDAARSAPSGKPPIAQNAAAEGPYPPPSGATLNPLNRLDATRIHAKLRELGFYRANSNTLWSAASRDALREFKSRNDLNQNDLWDAATEQRLMSAGPSLAAEDIQAGFAAATSGIWSIDIRACPGGIGGSDALPLTITQKRAETEGARCEFGNISGLGTNWKTVGTCTVNGETRKANISFVRTGDVLVWSSENGTTKYLRCPN